MNKALRVADYLGHIQDAIERIERHTANIDELGFIGEAANNIQRVNAVFAEANSAIPWQVMYAMRNRVSHGYDKVDFEMVWKTICNDFPDLYLQVKSVSQSFRL